MDHVKRAQGCAVNRISLFLLIMSIFSALEGFAQVSFEQPYTESVLFPNCDDSKTCTLKKFEITTQDYKITFSEGEISYGSRMFAQYQTEDVSQLEDYAIVQFIKGCHFKSRQRGSGFEYIYDVTRDSFDKSIPFVYKNWRVDSVDQDPVYNNTPPEFRAKWKTRHGLYRWNLKPGSFEPKSEMLYYESKPKVPSLYVVDRPGTAFFENGIAKNISLQFKTCLYKTVDLPDVVLENEVEFAKPLHCFQWASSFIYDSKKQDFIKTSQLHSACQ